MEYILKTKALNQFLPRKQGALLLCLSLLSCLVQAQTLEQVRSIIFEPVLIGEAPPRPSAPAQDERRLGNTLPTQPAPPLPEEVPTDIEFSQYERYIAELEMEDGPYSGELFQELLSLAYAYQEADDHENAIATFERAEHVSRINNGLFSLQQIESVEGMIESLIASGEMTLADEKQRYLVYLHEQIYGEDDTRMVPSLLNLADWNMDAFHEGIRFDAQGQMLEMLGAGFNSEEQVRRQAFLKLRQAQRSYLQAISNLIGERDYLDPRLPDMEKNLIETYFLQAYRDSILEDPDNYLTIRRRSSTGSLIRRPMYWNYTYSYRYGRDAYTRLLAYMQFDPETTVREYTDVLLELGDWYMLFGRRVLAERKYQEVLDILESVDIPETAYGDMLSPSIPITLPVFTPTPHTRGIYGIAPEQELDYRGYVDIGFRLNKFGRARSLKVTGHSDDTSRAVERRLISMLRNTQFRPFYRGGEIIDDEEFELRYYYTY